LLLLLYLCKILFFYFKIILIVIVNKYDNFNNIIFLIEKRIIMDNLYNNV